VRGGCRGEAALVRLADHQLEPARLRDRRRPPESGDPSQLDQLQVEEVDDAVAREHEDVVERLDALVRHDRDVRVLRDVAEAGQVPGVHRLLNVREVERCELPEARHRLAGRPRHVEVDRQRDVGPDRLPDRPDAVDVPLERPESRAHLQVPEPVGHVRRGLARGGVGRPVEDGLVARQGLPDGAAEELEHRHPVEPTDQVVERHVEGRSGAVGTDDGPVEVREERVPVPRVPPHELRAQVLEDLRDHPVGCVAGQIVGVPPRLPVPRCSLVGQETDVDLLEHAHRARGEVLERGLQRQVLPVHLDRGDLHAARSNAGSSRRSSGTTPRPGPSGTTRAPAS
jgi:hypothetical protein